MNEDHIGGRSLARDRGGAPVPEPESEPAQPAPEEPTPNDLWVGPLLVILARTRLRRSQE